MAAEHGESERRGWMTAGVVSVSASSFFSDAGHEITTATLPSFFTTTLHASAGALGLVEGISDGLIGLTKLVAGPLANDPDRRRSLASGGYLGTAAATGAIGLTVATWQAGILRALAWTARGLRTPARDSLLASLARPETYGRAFGLERAGDNLGAVLGPLLAAGLVAWLGIRPTLYLAAIPGLFALVAIGAAARQARRRAPGTPSPRARLNLGGLRDAGLARALLPIVPFELGNVAAALLIFRATQLLQQGGRSATAAASVAILLYAGHNAVAAALSFLGGHWIDTAGPRIVFGAGALLYLLAYAGFAAGPQGWGVVLLAFALAGGGIGLAETAEGALVARLLPDHPRGSGFGVLGGVQALGGFAASAAVGLLVATVSPAVGFGYAAGWMLLSAAGVAISHGHGRSPRPPRQ